MPPRKTVKKTAAQRKSRTWQDIDQSVRMKPMSSASERRVWLSRLRVAGIVLAVALVGFFGLRFAGYIESAPELIAKAGEYVPINSVEVDTDGKLSEALLLKTLQIDPDANLVTVDLHGMKERLEAIGQVKSAVVSRRFMDSSIVAKVQERVPIARLVALRENGERLMLFVDAEGVVFSGDALDLRTARSLPFLDGIELSKLENGYSPVEGIAPLAKLLFEARAIAPHLYSRWRVVSLKREDRLIAKGRFAQEIVFAKDDDFRTQLGRLDYILDHQRSLGRESVGRIDLTLGDDAAVKAL